MLNVSLLPGAEVSEAGFAFGFLGCCRRRRAGRRPAFIISSRSFPEWEEEKYEKAAKQWCGTVGVAEFHLNLFTLGWYRPCLYVTVCYVRPWASSSPYWKSNCGLAKLSKRLFASLRSDRVTDKFSWDRCCSLLSDGHESTHGEPGKELHGSEFQTASVIKTNPQVIRQSGRKVDHCQCLQGLNTNKDH